MSSTTSLNSKKVLAVVTGASGFVGAAVALRFLDLGHSVRLPLRKQQQADAWLSEHGSKYEGRIETVVLKKGITEDGVFDEAVKGADVVVHAASPASFGIEGGAEEAYLKPAIAGTLSILKSAKKSGTVKSFVYTTSVVAFTRLDEFVSASKDSILTESSWNRTTYEEAAQMPQEAAGEIYSASKGLAEKAAWDFVKTAGVDFAFSSVAPSCVLGHYSVPPVKSLADTGSTFQMATAFLLDQENFPPHDGTGFQPEHYISISDVARAHVDAALNRSVSDGHRYLLIADRATWEPVARSMLKSQPVLEGHLPKLPEVPSEEEKARSVFQYDAGGVERDFGWKYQPFDEYVGEYATQLVELARADGKL